MLFAKHKEREVPLYKWRILYPLPVIIGLVALMVLENYSLTHLQAEEMSWVNGKVSHAVVLSPYPKADRHELSITLASHDSTFAFLGDTSLIQQIEEAISDGSEVNIGYFPGVFPFSFLRDSFQGLMLVKHYKCLYAFDQGKSHLSSNWLFGAGIVILLLGIYIFCLGRWYGGFW